MTSKMIRGQTSLLQVKVLENLYPVVVLPALVVLLQQVVNLASLNLRHLLVQFVLQLLQDLSLAEPLADASDSTHVLAVFLRGY
jgi:hypothetical protein